MAKTEELQRKHSTENLNGEPVYYVETRDTPAFRWGSTLLEIIYALHDCENVVNRSKNEIYTIQQKWFPVNDPKPNKEGLRRLKVELSRLEKNIKYVKDCFDFYAESKSLVRRANRALRKMS